MKGAPSESNQLCSELNICLLRLFYSFRITTQTMNLSTRRTRECPAIKHRRQIKDPTGLLYLRRQFKQYSPLKEEEQIAYKAVTYANTAINIT